MIVVGFVHNRYEVSIMVYLWMDWRKLWKI